MGDFVPPPIQIPATLMEDLTSMGAFLDVCSRAHGNAVEMVQRLHEDLAGAPFGSNYRMLAYVLFSKGFMTFQAVRNLCLLGCGPDALGLCASLFENVVDLIFIRQAPVRRSNRYIRFEQVDKYYQIKKVLGRKRLPRGTRARYEGYMRFVAPEATKYLRFFPTSRAGWSGKSLRERAKAVKMDLEYDELYYFFCGVKHTLPMGAVGFVFEQGDFVDVIRGPNIKGVYLAALYSTRYLLKLCDLLQDAYGLTAQENSLQHLMSDLFRESEAVRQLHPELCV